MNVYEYAMKVEKDGEEYYRELASNSDNTGLKKIFNMLADEEVKHYHIFKSMMKNDMDKLENLKLLTDTKTIFETLSNEKNSVNFDLNQIQYYKDAVEKEDNSYEFYSNEAKKSDNEKEKNIFLKIADEEVKHKKVLEEIVSFVEEPANWVESAEF